MENSRNSAAYSSRTANPPLQPLPDGYLPKRTSYRRPIDAQPAPAQPQAPATSNPIPNSARPVAAAPAPNGASRTSSHRRRQSQQIPPPASGATNESLPAAPDVPRGPPPTSYRDPYAPKGSSRGPTRSYPSRSRDPTLQMNSSRQQPNVIAANRLQELRSPPYAPVEPLSGNIEGVSRSNSQRRPSVPDRSPLQKLEGKLDDISKEEKRARILEMELAAQEKAEAEMRARRAREAAAKQQRIVSGPVPDSERAGTTPNRAASTKRHVSMPTPAQPKSPEIGELSEPDDDYAYDLSEPWDPSGGRTAGVPHRIPSQSKDQRLSTGSQRHKNRLSHVDGTVGRTPSVKGKEPVGTARGAGSFSDRTGVLGNVDGADAQKVSRKPVAAPAGLGLFGVEDAPNASRSVGAGVSRYDSRRLSKDLPPTPRELVNNKNDRRRDSRGIMAAQMEMEQERIDNKQSTRGFDYLQPQTQTQPPLPPSYQTHDPPPAQATRRAVGFAPSVPDPGPQDSQESHHESHHRFPNVFSHHHEPDRRYVAPPMLDEWRNAPIASLVAEDLDLDVPDRSNGTKKAWWEESTSTRRRRSSGYAEPSYDGYVDEPTTQTTFSPPLYLKCGPLLRYTGLRKDKSRTGREREIWRGSVMIVTVDEQSSYQSPPTLRLFKQPMDLLPPPPAELNGEELNPAYVDPLEGQVKMSRNGKTLYAKPIDEIAENEDLSREETDHGLFQETHSLSPTGANMNKSSRIHKRDGEKLGKLREIAGIRLHAERGVTFWRFNLEIELGTGQARIAYRINRGPAIGFWVPGKGEMMNIMFHSCNGFSLSVEPKEFCGPDPLWRDVLNSHQTRPFHVMIGGGDQIYNDAAMRQTTLFKQWTESKNPLQKHGASFSSELQNELELFYLDRYSMWFSQGLFGMANSQIPMINIWDDHDIIDGYGSYPHHFMQTPVFTGLGAVAFKYYMLFQHQSVVAETDKTEPSWILGMHPGPYIKEQSRSVFMHLGRQAAFLGLDCRTERQRDEILTEDSYDVIFDRLEDEIIKGETKHLIVLMGVPIAYPRLNFLENILTSRLMDPLKALGRAGMLGGFVNKFDGGVEILDDLDDHWTAKHHKDERNWLIRELQHIASTKSVRVTILGGDVHLAAVGQFYTNKKLNIPKDKDHRYMPNVISSAIVNTPPPEMMADILNKRNKVHHLDPFTDEDMIPLFTHDVDGKKRNNTHLLPRRNWCSLREYKPGTTPPSTPSPPPSPGEGPRLTRTLSDYTPGKMVRRMSGGGGSRRGRKSGPPVAYYNNPANVEADERQTGVHEPQSSFSPDRSSEERPRSRRNSFTSLFRRRASVDSVNPPGSSHSMPLTRNRNNSETDERPNAFHRRPSVLGKKGHKREGDYINLEGGLDICLNLEQSQHDPAGITTPYRLLVPALYYTAPETGAVQPERRKSRIGSVFGVFGGGGRKKRTVGDDGYSHSGSEVESESGDEDLEDMDDEERTRQRYKVGPRILIPGFGSRKRASLSHPNDAPPSPKSQALPQPQTQNGERSLQSGSYANPTPPITGYDGQAHNQDQRYANHRQSIDAPVHGSNSAWESVAGRRHVSAPITNHTHTHTHTHTQTTTIPSRSNSNHRKNPTYNSSHKSQLPEPEPKVHRRSMGGILNQHGDAKFEHDAHVATHTPATQRSKRESYPPHPAIVGAGPGSPYSRGGLTSRDGAGSGDYFASGGRNGSAGVGARYLGGGRYADDDYDDEDEDSIDGRSYSGKEHISQESFVPPKPKSKWKIWR